MVNSTNPSSHCGKFESAVAYFFSHFSLIVLIMSRPTPIGIRHEVLACPCKGMWQSALAGRMGLPPATVNHILRRHAATGTLGPGKPTRVGRSHLVKTVLCAAWSDRIASEVLGP